jgi:hypothetical protein
MTLLMGMGKNIYLRYEIRVLLLIGPKKCQVAPCAIFQQLQIVEDS